MNMANIKHDYDIEAVHNEWCRENGYPVRKRHARFPGRPKLKASSAKLQASGAKLQADNLNADNSERFVKNAKRPV